MQGIIDKFENRDLSFQPLIIFVKNSILNTPLEITSENVLVEFILEQKITMNQIMKKNGVLGVLDVYSHF